MGGRANVAAGDPGHITDADVNNYQIHSPDNAHHLTGTQAGTTYNNGWEDPTEIQIVNGGQYQVNLGAGWNDYDFVANTKAAYQETVFIATFKAAAIPANSYDAMANADILAYQKPSPDGHSHTITANDGAVARNGG